MDNYFELFEVPESLQLDATVLKKQFYKLSKQYHPDRWVLASQEEQEAALKQAALINEAYQVLSDPDTLMAYVLRLHGMLQDEDRYALPADFLMEMMELNETLSDFETEPQNQVLRQQIAAALAQQMKEWSAAVAPLIERFDQDPTAVLAALKDFYFRKKYLLRIQERYLTFASR